MGGLTNLQRQQGLWTIQVRRDLRFVRQTHYQNPLFSPVKLPFFLDHILKSLSSNTTFCLLNWCFPMIFRYQTHLFLVFTRGRERSQDDYAGRLHRLV